MRRQRHAVTLLEVLIAIAIIALLTGISVVAVQKIRAAAAQAQCANQLKQLGLACHSAHDQHKSMPPAFGFYPGNDIYGGSTGLGTVFFHLLPFVDQHALYKQSRYQPPLSPGETRQRDFFLDTANDVSKTSVALFNCVADPTLRPGVDAATNTAPSSYAANYLVFGTVDADFANDGSQGKPQLPATFRDGASQTILFAEKYASASNGAFKGGCHWASFQGSCHNPLFAFYEPARNNLPAPTDANAVGPTGATFQVRPNAGSCNPCLPATGHASMNVCMGDASVRPLAFGIAASAWWGLVTPAGGDAAGVEP